MTLRLFEHLWTVIILLAASLRCCHIPAGTTLLVDGDANRVVELGALACRLLVCIRLQLAFLYSNTR